MREIYSNIFLIREKGSLGAIKPPENIYVIAGKNGLIFDAGYGNIWTIKRLIRQVRLIKKRYKKKEIPCKITRILPSHVHPDHFSGLKKLRKYLKIKIMLTKKMARIIKNKQSYLSYYESKDPFHDEFKAPTTRNILTISIQKIFTRTFFNLIYGMSFIKETDIIIKERSKISINGDIWQIFPSPGHSSDHISLYNEEKGILFSGDNVLRSITTWLGPPNSNIEEYINTIKKIQNLPNLQLILPAHGSPIKNPSERLQEILSHRQERTTRILNLIRNSSNQGLKVNDIIKALYPQDGKLKHGVARGWIVLTLKMLSSKNLIIAKIIGKELLFFPSL
jgi:glyoxylase-like metal-dependent hydrolase (beta-lactamase superfamily II)